MWESHDRERSRGENWLVAGTRPFVYTRMHRIPTREVPVPDPDNGPALDRRHFLGTASASAALVGSLAARAADDRPQPASVDGRPPVTNPRSTSGDLRHGPKWDESFTLTVGNDKGDLNGTDQRVTPRMEFSRCGRSERNGSTVRSFSGRSVRSNW